MMMHTFTKVIGVVATQENTFSMHTGPEFFIRKHAVYVTDKKYVKSNSNHAKNKIIDLH